MDIFNRDTFFFIVLQLSVGNQRLLESVESLSSNFEISIWGFKRISFYNLGFLNGKE